ncbi:hypothetical protein A5320_18315 [Rheinheimera sp. SA_1]|uniref:4'-phosphopantetheinyl transferase family protein n=1 Tax=Rheinheimera sp. SA_1 TaxID=1827365 RepID=UPI0007FCAAFE|nr:4'-phosphopantetheinyl transferase superfamily protein [Rheinheimera sp. SA_1]OBP13502.1 hypothetical protein A5320_18315 [Rheinheimera sp. SA_1]
MVISDPPFPFLSALPSAISKVASLSQIQLFSDTSEKLILAQGNFSLEAYQQTDFADLELDCPAPIKGAVAKRQAEYFAGRYLARLAMQQSGLFNPAPPQLGIGRLRAPTWPKTVTGSITHHQQKACAVVLTQPLSAKNFVGVDTELWLTAQQSIEIAEFIHNSEERQILVSAGFTDAQATSLLFSAKEALFKAICPFVGEYFGFESAELKECSGPADTTQPYRGGWLKLRLLTDWVIANAPQQDYYCWFSCSEFDVLTLVCSDGWSIGG